MATSMVLDAIEQAIWTRQQEGVLDLKDVLNPRRQVPGRLDRRVFEHLHVVEQVSVVWFVNPIICCMIGDDSPTL